MSENETVALPERSAATGRLVLEVDPATLVVEAADRERALAATPDDGADAIPVTVVVWRSDGGQLVVRAGARRVLEAVAAGEQSLRAEVQTVTVTGMELLEVAPELLVIGLNTRRTVSSDERFVSDVADRGVQQPIGVRLDDFGRLVVRTGQRRALAALEAKLSRVAVVVTPGRVDEDKEGTIARVIEQLAENEHRAGLPETDEVAATLELVGLGLSGARIAKLRHLPRRRVAATIAVGQCDAAAAALGDGVLDLMRAQVLTEFADDEAAVERLLAAAARSAGSFDHVAQRLRDDRELMRRREAKAAELAAQGVPLAEDPDDALRLDALRATPEAKRYSGLTAEAHAKCPGHAFKFGYEDTVVYVCTDFRTYGHAMSDAPDGEVVAAGAGPLSDAQRAERRVTRENNLAMASASRLRLAWIQRFLRGSKP
ncbi:MAG TPA: ParB N-terminal domain-containing protein, partial [Conexibacter sp.]|nr:ParB N-terminal domain-containing protein [Conexibacter sp.]